MPVSPIKWASCETGRVEQVFGVAYGTKRKNDEIRDPYHLNDLFDKSQTNNDVEMMESGEQPPVDIVNQEPHIQGAPALSRPLVSVESEMIMNINDDDDDNAGELEMNDYYTACDAMDGEGAVNPSQYGRVPSQHEAHCFGPEKSPNSGNVRCYCRPTWDTMRSSNSFCSDIY